MSTAYTSVRKNAVASSINNRKYKFPFQLFLILEKMPVVFFTSEAVTSNHYILLIPKCWKQPLITGMKYESMTSLTFLVDSTIVDSYDFSFFSKEENLYVNTTRLLRLDNYFSLQNKVRYTIIEGESTRSPFLTSSGMYKNAVWLEREFLEMYGALLSTNADTRNLLLEYSFTANPMLRTYPTEGYSDVYYDFFSDQLCYVQHDYVEL